MTAATRAAAVALAAAMAVAQVAGAARAQAPHAEIGEDYAHLEQLYRHLHSHPELSYQEAETAKRIAAELRALGFAVTEGVGGHGVVAIMENGDGPTVMLRTDLDALPVAEQTGLPYASRVKAVEQTGQEVPVMHACGHDVHMTVLVGTARWLAAHRDRWSGRLMLIGQPAEERGAGARKMLEDGLFTRFPKPDYALALHVNAALPAGTVAYVPGYALANVDSVDITVHGIGGHGAYPQATKDPIVLASEIVLALQTIASREIDPQDPVVVTVGSIHGGAKHNIIPDRVDLQLTVRSYSDETRHKVLEAIRRIAVNMGRVAGLPDDLLPEVKIHEEEYTPATYNDPELTERLAAALAARFGSERVIRAKPVMGGEDFSRYGRAGVKAVMLWLGAVDPDKWRLAQEGKLSLPSLHSPFFAPLPRPTITTGVETMVTSVLALMGRRDGAG
ncbi:MAG: peptidase [Rhodothalassiaceae bacterium]|nr:MAG: peptidase [Rhodothalassiaceae bacterium]